MIVLSRIKFILLVSSFILLSNSLWANTLTQYRLHGIKNLEKQLDYDLTQQNYWNDYLKDVDTQFGYIESYNNILTCDKSGSTLALYRKDSNNSYSLTKEYNAFTGKMKGDKLKEGDLKTPVGVYTITKKISKVDSFYGPLAFVTSYPNMYDKYRGKNGSGIWIHGLPTEQERDEYTKGCIAINNPSIECLDKNIDIEQTVLIIHEEDAKKNVAKQTFSTVLAQLYAWRYAWLYNDSDSYLNFYDKKFLRFDGMNLSTFTNYKKRIFRKQESKSILFSEINVIPYPGTKNMFKIKFFETYKSNSFSFSGNKVLIIQLIDDKMKIITEK